MYPEVVSSTSDGNLVLTFLLGVDLNKVVEALGPRFVGVCYQTRVMETEGSYVQPSLMMRGTRSKSEIGDPAIGVLAPVVDDLHFLGKFGVFFSSGEYVSLDLSKDCAEFMVGLGSVPDFNCKLSPRYVLWKNLMQRNEEVKVFEGLLERAIAMLISIQGKDNSSASCDFFVIHITLITLMEKPDGLLYGDFCLIMIGSMIYSGTVNLAFSHEGLKGKLKEVQKVDVVSILSQDDCIIGSSELLMDTRPALQIALIAMDLFQILKERDMFSMFVVGKNHLFEKSQCLNDSQLYTAVEDGELTLVTLNLYDADFVTFSLFITTWKSVLKSCVQFCCAVLNLTQQRGNSINNDFLISNKEVQHLKECWKIVGTVVLLQAVVQVYFVVHGNGAYNEVWFVQYGEVSFSLKKLWLGGDLCQVLEEGFCIDMVVLVRWIAVTFWGLCAQGFEMESVFIGIAQQGCSGDAKGFHADLGTETRESILCLTYVCHTACWDRSRNQFGSGFITLPYIWMLNFIVKCSEYLLLNVQRIKDVLFYEGKHGYSGECAKLMILRWCFLLARSVLIDARLNSEYVPYGNIVKDISCGWLRQFAGHIVKEKGVNHLVLNVEFLAAAEKCIHGCSVPENYSKMIKNLVGAWNRFEGRRVELQIFVGGMPQCLASFIGFLLYRAKYGKRYNGEVGSFEASLDVLVVGGLIKEIRLRFSGSGIWFAESRLLVRPNYLLRIFCACCQVVILLQCDIFSKLRIMVNSSCSLVVSLPVQKMPTGSVLVAGEVNSEFVDVPLIDIWITRSTAYFKQSIVGFLFSNIGELTAFWAFGYTKL